MLNAQTPNNLPKMDKNFSHNRGNALTTKHSHNCAQHFLSSIWPQCLFSMHANVRTTFKYNGKKPVYKSKQVILLIFISCWTCGSTEAFCSTKRRQHVLISEQPSCDRDVGEYGGWKGQIPAWGQSSDLSFATGLLSWMHRRGDQASVHNLF